MGIELIANPHKEDEKDPKEVWANTEMDELRRKECLCLNCGKKDEKPPYGSCPVAGKLYKVCVEHDMAMMITRCGATDKKGELLYKPLE